MNLPKKLLIVEDDPDMSKLLSQRAKKFHFECREDLCGTHCVDVAVDYEPDAIILDLNLPQITGYDVLLLLKQHPALKDIPVIVLSVFADKEIIDGAKELGAKDYFIKGDNLNTLFQRVEDCLK